MLKIEKQLRLWFSYHMSLLQLVTFVLQLCVSVYLNAPSFTHIRAADSCEVSKPGEASHLTGYGPYIRVKKIHRVATPHWLAQYNNCGISQPKTIKKSTPTTSPF